MSRRYFNSHNSLFPKTLIILMGGKTSVSAFELELRKQRGSKQTFSLLKTHSARSPASQTSVILGYMLQGKLWDIDCCSCFLLIALQKWLYFASAFLVIYFSP